VTLTAVTDEQMKAGIVQGNRPPLDALNGNADLVSFAKRWIPRCWHQSPDERPKFDGKYSNVEIYSGIMLIWFEAASLLCI